MAYSGYTLSTTGEPVISDASLEDLSPRFQVASERFSTKGLSEIDRVEKWEDHNAKALVGLAARTLDDASLEATEINLHLPTLHFAQVTANEHVIERTARHIASKPADSVVLYFSLYGDSFFYHRGGARALAPGSVLVYDTDKPFMRGFAKGLKELVLMVPRDTFKDISDGGKISEGDPHVLGFGKSNKSNDFATAIAETVSQSLANPDTSSFQESENEVIDLLRGIFASSSATGISSQYRIASAYIDRHLRDPHLSAPVIARSIGVSDRQLSRIYSEQGTHLSREILRKRLELAQRVLQSTIPDQMTVGDVARYSGFNSSAHFSRAFKAHFGHSPKVSPRKNGF